MKKLLYFLIFILFSSSVCAAPPFVAQTINFDYGLIIEYQPIDYIEIDQDYTIHHHIFNGSNGVLKDNTTTNCDVWLIDNTGSLLYNEQNISTSDGSDFYVTFTSSNFSSNGVYVYHIYCEENNRGAGGFVTQRLTVTLDGEEDFKNDNTAGVATVIFIISISLFILLLPMFKTFSKNELLNLILKRSCYVIGLVLMAFNSGILATIIQSSGMNLTSEMFRYMHLFGWSTYVFAVILVISSIFESLKLWRENVSNKRLGF